jgi:CRISPR/Cas system-associated protein Cas5 (RAMP superfamily)
MRYSQSEYHDVGYRYEKSVDRQRIGDRIKRMLEEEDDQLEAKYHIDRGRREARENN